MKDKYWMFLFIFLFVSVILFASYMIYNTQTNKQKYICLVVSPTYLLNCNMNGTIVQARSSPENLKQIKDRYHCVINKTETNFNLASCSEQTKYPKYKIEIEKY